MTKEEEFIYQVMDLVQTCDGHDFAALERAIPIAKEKLKAELEFTAKANEFNEYISTLINEFCKANKTEITSVSGGRIGAGKFKLSFTMPV